MHSRMRRIIDILSQYYRGPIVVLLKPLGTILPRCLRGFRVALKLAYTMLKDASLSDGCTSIVVEYIIDPPLLCMKIGKIIINRLFSLNYYVIIIFTL